MDPWLINPMYAHCGEVNWAEGTGIDCVQTQVDALLTKIRRKHKEYGINEKPFVVVKANNGTYGMGIMTVRDAKELDEVNRRTRDLHSFPTRRSSDLGRTGARGDHPGRCAHL